MGFEVWMRNDAGQRVFLVGALSTAQADTLVANLIGEGIEAWTQ